MSHFHGSVKGNRGAATRGGTKKSGPKTDKNIYVIYQSQWHGKGVDREIARGIIGD